MSFGLRIEKVQRVCDAHDDCSDCPLEKMCPAMSAPRLWDIYEIDKALKGYCSCGKKIENPKANRCNTCNRLYMKRCHTVRKENGLCHDCGKPLKENEARLCQSCIDRRRMYDRRVVFEKMKARTDDES